MAFSNGGLFRQIIFLPHTWAKTYSGQRYVPLIKFRYPGKAKTSKNASVPVSPPAAKQGKAKTSKNASVSVSPSGSKQGKVTTMSKSGAIEDWELPRRYQRKRMTQTEMDYINSGGAP